MTRDELLRLRRPHLVALHGLTDDDPKKIGLVLGDSRVPGKVRIATYSVQGRCWSTPHAETIESLQGPAPADWKATKAARRTWELGRRPFGVGGRP